MISYLDNIWYFLRKPVPFADSSRFSGCMCFDTQYAIHIFGQIEDHLAFGSRRCSAFLSSNVKKLRERLIAYKPSGLGEMPTL